MSCCVEHGELLFLQDKARTIGNNMGLRTLCDPNLTPFLEYVGVILKLEILEGLDFGIKKMS